MFTNRSVVELLCPQFCTNFHHISIFCVRLENVIGLMPIVCETNQKLFANFPGVQILNLAVFFAGCLLIGVDQHSCVYVMRTMNTRDPVTEVSPVYLVNMFEYLLTSGFDFSDVLTAVKSGIAQIALLSLTFCKIRRQCR